MKKKALILSMILGAFIMTSCGIPKSSIDVEYNVDNYVTLAKNYKNIPVTIQGKFTIDEEMEKTALENLIKSAAPYREDPTKKVVEKDSVVNVDYVGKVDGKEFKGGSAKGVSIDVSSNSDAVQGTSYIEGFAKGLIGKSKGDKATSQVVFPKNYQAKNLAGKNAEFTFTINSIMKKVTVDSIDDAYAKKYFKMDTVKELKNMVNKTLTSRLEASKNQQIRSEAIKTVVKNSKVKYPKKLLELRKNEFLIRFKKNAKIKDNKEFKKYLKNNLKVSEDKFNKETEKTIKDNLKIELVFEAIAKKENIKFDKKGYKDFIAGLKQTSRVASDKELFKKYDQGEVKNSGEKYIKKMYVATKAISYVEKHAKVTIKPSK